MTPDHLRGLELARAGRTAEAETVFRALLEADPDDADALHFFAVCASQRQDYREAERLLQQAIASRPGWAKGWNSLGRIYRSMRQFGDAAASYEQAIRYSPTDAELYCEYAHALRESGQLPAAAEALRRAIEIQPASADAHVSLAAVLKDLNLDAQAETEGLCAVSIDPHHAEAHNIVGIVQRRQGRYRDAETHYREAVALNPSIGLYGCNLATLMREAGRLDEAEAEYRRVIDIDPFCAEAYRHLANMTRIEPEDPVYARLQSLLGNTSLSPQQRTEMLFAIARVLEDQKDYDAAFRYWEEANRLKRSTIHYDDAMREDLARATIEIFDRALLDRHVGHGNPTDAPIFIVGMPRSGTTLVEQIVASHSRVTAAGELPVLGRIADAAGYPASFSSAKGIGGTLDAMGNDYLALAHPAGTGRFTDKMPGNYLRIGLIRLILPNARIVHCRRDPVDTCLWCYRQLFTGSGQPYSYDLRELGLEYRRYERLMEHWRTVAPEVLYEIQYESLIDNAETEIRRLLDFCGLPFEPGCLDFHETDRPIRTASASQVRQPIYRGAQGRWKKYEAYLAPLLRVLEG